MTVEAARQPGRSPRRPGAAVPQFRHQSCSAPSARRRHGTRRSPQVGSPAAPAGSSWGLRSGFGRKDRLCLQQLHMSRVAHTEGNAQSTGAVADGVRAQARAISRRSVGPLTACRRPARRRARPRWRDLDERETLEHRTLRTASPSSPAAAVIAWMMSEARARRRGRRRAISLHVGPSPLRETCGLECRRGALGDRGRRDVRALDPRRELDAGVVLDRLDAHAAAAARRR